MITSIYKQIHPETGIIEITINTEEKWVSYQINRLDEEHKIVMSFYNTKSVEYMYGQWQEEETETIEYIDMNNDFNPFDYVIYHSQVKNQITLLLVPRIMLRDRKHWKECE